MTQATTFTSTGDDALPTIRPWVGSRYGREGALGAKVLFLGESMYSFSGEEPLEHAVNPRCRTVRPRG